MLEQIIQRYKDANPMWAHRMGFHEYDGQLIDYSKEKQNSRIDQIKLDIKMLTDGREPEDKLAKFNYNLVLSALETELFLKNVKKEYKISPLPYLSPLNIIEISYAAREFTSIENRIESIIKLQSQIPKLMKQAKENMDKSLSRPKVVRSIAVGNGLISYFSDKLIEFVTQTSQDELIQKWSVTNEIAVKALEDFVENLENDYLPNVHDEYALGEKNFLEMLEKTESVKITYERLQELGEATLKRDKDELIKMAKSKNMTVAELKAWAYEDKPKPEELIKVVKEIDDKLLDFLIRKNIVTLPSREQVLVSDYPKSVKTFALAGLNIPGPFEPPEAKQGYYYLNVPTPDMPEKQQKMLNNFFNLTQLENISIHEAWPGHYLQLLYSNTSDNDIAKMFARSYSLIEGWGLYTEQMMCDVGYDGYDEFKLRVAQLDLSMLRTGRYLVAINMHCKGMTIEEATKLFVEEILTNEEIGRNQATRGTMDPMFLNYTLGKLMILKLREDYKKEQGDSFTLKGFHDEMLKYASPPITVLRKMILKNPDTGIL